MIAGLLVTLSGWFFFDLVTALCVALWMIWSTLSEVLGSHADLFWPEEPVCGHAMAHEVRYP